MLCTLTKVQSFTLISSSGPLSTLPSASSLPRCPSLAVSYPNVTGRSPVSIVGRLVHHIILPAMVPSPSSLRVNIHFTTKTVRKVLYARMRSSCPSIRLHLEPETAGIAMRAMRQQPNTRPIIRSRTSPFCQTTAFPDGIISLKSRTYGFATLADRGYLIVP